MEYIASVNYKQPIGLQEYTFDSSESRRIFLVGAKQSTMFLSSKTWEEE